MSDKAIEVNKRTKTIILVLNFFLLAVMTALDICYMFIGGTPLKGVASLTFDAVGAVNMIYAIRVGAVGKYKYVMPIALTVAMAGDIAINFDFIVGAAVFALGHVVYVAAYYVKNGFRYSDLICAACIFVPSVLVITLVPVFDFGGALLEVVCVVYALILSAMTGKAISDCVNDESADAYSDTLSTMTGKDLSDSKKRSTFSIVVAVGSVLFFISDLALLINKFCVMGGGGKLMTRVLCLATYYPAQFLLAFSVFLFATARRTAADGMTSLSD